MLYQIKQLLMNLLFVSSFALFTETVPLAVEKQLAISTFAKDNIVLAQPALSFYRISGAIIKKILEDNGYAVQIKEGTHENIFPLLGKGEVDLFNAVWLPEGHKLYYNQYKEGLVKLSMLYDHAAFFLAIPSYAPDDIISVGDLVKKNSDIIKQIQGISSGAGISIMTKAAIVGYGLGKNGFIFMPGTSTDWLHAFDTAYNQHKVAVIPLWQPSWLTIKYSLRKLKDEKNILSSNEEVWLVAQKNISSKIDEATLAALKKIKLSVDIITELDYEINVNNMPLEKAVDNWITNNQELYQSWLH